MSRSSVFRAVAHCFRTLSLVVIDLVRLASLAAHSRSALAAENLFLRKQLALFQERKVKPRLADDAARWTMATLSRMFPWGNSLMNVKPDTLIRWQRKGFRLFWRWKSKPRGRPRLPKDLRQLIREMAAENPTWGEERIANELKLKLGIRVSPRTVAKYLHDRPVRAAEKDGAPARACPTLSTGLQQDQEVWKVNQLSCRLWEPRGLPAVEELSRSGDGSGSLRGNVSGAEDIPHCVDLKSSIDLQGNTHYQSVDVTLRPGSDALLMCVAASKKKRCRRGSHVQQHP
jgi:Homeodomain-like domain